MVGGAHAGLPVDVAALDGHAQYDRLDGPACFRDLLPAAVGEGRDGESAVGQPVGEPLADQPHERLARDGEAYALFPGEVLRFEGVTRGVVPAHDRALQVCVDLLGKHLLPRGSGGVRHASHDASIDDPANNRLSVLLSILKQRQ